MAQNFPNHIIYTRNTEESNHSGRSSTITISEEDASASRDADNNDAASKQLRHLQFVNPGKFMEDFDPECSAREMRKVNRRIYRETVRKNQVYDEQGRLLADISKDLCDCLEKTCPGCHFPCSKCGSQKCGAECRCNRRWYYSELEVEGGDYKWTCELPSAP